VTFSKVAVGQELAFQTALEKDAFGQAIALDSPDRLLPLLFATDPTISSENVIQFEKELRVFCQSLQKNKSHRTSEKDYLKEVFKQVRQKYLRTYAIYPSFSQIALTGTYNCLTGSALYGYVFSFLGYPVEFRETSYHAYLRLSLPQEEYLVDATDPLGGFVAGAIKVGERELWYASNELRSGQCFNQSISFRQLCGIQYFNEGVIAFNRRSYSESIAFLQKANHLYPQSQRIQALKTLAQQYSKGSTVATSQVVGAQSMHE
jgi:hypothetical protein